MKKEELKMWKKYRDSAVEDLKKMKPNTNYFVVYQMEDGRYKNFQHGTSIFYYGLTHFLTKLADSYYQPNHEEILENTFNKWLLFYDLISKQEVEKEKVKIKVKSK